MKTEDSMLKDESFTHTLIRETQNVASTFWSKWAKTEIRISPSLSRMIPKE
ncbi:hypothetical protein SAMN04488691_103223 [Haloferax larsenii]|uniref:Uncharacterized protein n=1 Tax=Haloferax larsenii TaxID=302484 RepID=A0A1H7N8J6_HALLR|nr:hypothetical protein SAMN04488691_103223 [Haloferax larsenii]